MKLKEYAKVIAVLAEKYPNAKVIFSIDDEGNAYNEVFYHHIPKIYILLFYLIV